MKQRRQIANGQEQILQFERRFDFAYTLARINWDYFITLTFKNPVPRPPIAYGMAWRFCREASAISDTPYKNLLLALRGEEGEKNGRFHFHLLIAGTNTRNRITLQHQLEHAWRVVSGNAISDVRQYNRSLGGAEYVAKCLGANDYEIGKYSLANTVTLSHSVVSLIRAMDAKGDRRHSEHIRKDKQVAIPLGLAGAHQGISICDETVSLRSLG